MVLVKETKGYEPKRKTGMWGKNLIGGSIGDIGGMKQRRWSKRKQKVVCLYV